MALILSCAGLGLFLLTGCQTSMPSEALAMRPQALQKRQMQSRRFNTSDENKMLVACAALLQDLGFNIEESSSDVGLVVASKDRSAVETGQVIGSFILTLLSGSNTPYDKSQRFRASIVSKPTDDHKSIVVRVTFQRTVWNTQNAITRNEALENPEQYLEFFQKLSKAIFLEANDI
jgi:hypothetical protein